jgi:hypothetical protein
MKRRLIIRPEAYADLAEAHDWYESKRWGSFIPAKITNDYSMSARNGSKRGAASAARAGLRRPARAGAISYRCNE